METVSSYMEKSTFSKDFKCYFSEVAFIFVTYRLIKILRLMHVN